MELDDAELLRKIDRFFRTEEKPPDAFIKILKKMAPSRRLKTAFYLFDLGRAALRGSVKASHPDWKQSVIEAEVARRISFASE